MTAAWPRADQRLERAYRRLLLAYPGRYRRRHGAEIVTTLLELAEPGQGRPRRADAWHLIASGVRQRFRLPAGRPAAWVVAVMITLIVGAFGAALGSWAGAQALAELPGDATIARLATGGQAISAAESDHDPSPWSAEMVSVGADIGATWDIEQARAAFAADGWSIEMVPARGGSAYTTDPVTGAQVPLPMRSAAFVAESDGVQIRVDSHQTVGNPGWVSATAWALPVATYLPLVAVGLVLGLVAGWLAAAALTYRLARAARPRPGIVVTAAALLALALPTAALYANAVRAVRYAGTDNPVFTVHSAFTPGPFYPFGPSWLVAALSVAGIVLAAAVVLLSRPGGAVAAQQSPAAT